MHSAILLVTFKFEEARARTQRYHVTIKRLANNWPAKCLDDFKLQPLQLF